jgi:hypothetical protein
LPRCILAQLRLFENIENEADDRNENKKTIQKNDKKLSNK